MSNAVSAGLIMNYKAFVFKLLMLSDHAES